MALAPYSSSTSTKPPPPKNSNAQALAEHIALVTGNDPATVPAPYTPAYSDAGAGPGQLASNTTTVPQYGGVPALLNQFLAAEGSPLAGRGRIFTKKSRKYGIDPRLLVAIAGAETSLMKDPNAAPMSEHNAWGMGPGLEYGSWAKGADATARNLAYNYFGQGLNTIDEISSKWAPVGAANDPNHVNENWSQNVSDYMKRLNNIVGKDQAQKLYPVLGNVKWTSLGGVDAHMSRPLGNWQSDNAIDMGAPVGTPVYAPAGGRLVGGFGDSSNGGTVWGNRLTLDPRKPGLPEWFMTHMGSFAPGISAGDRVHRGDVLGYIGARDSAWSPHLHFGQEFGNPETTVTRNLYDPTSSVPAYRGTASNSGAYAGQATPAQEHDQQQAQQMNNNAAGAIMAKTEADYPNYRRKKRGGSNSEIEALIQALLAGQAGQNMMV
jgi:murein DD-endopeptidase MepM/ murein hydrolase activator NlpD